MRLKELRKEKKLTQADISKIINVSQVGYNNYETEKREIPLNSLIALADYYNVSLDYLVGRERVNDIGYLTPEQTTLVKVIKKLNQQNIFILTGRAMAMLDNQGD